MVVVKCVLCEAMFENKEAMLSHRVTHDTTCDQCGLTCDGDLGLQVHRQIGCNINICIICTTQFRNPSSLRRHQLCHAKDKRASCPVCKTKFYKTYMPTHLKIHNNEFIKCNQCKRSFRGYHGLKVHMSKGCHVHVCKYCKKVFNRAQGLRTHERTHLIDRRHKCPMCKVKVPEAQFTNHMKTHRYLKQCNRCKRSFKGLYGLKIHLSRGSCVHGCKVCNKKFPTAYRLKTHLTVHTGQDRVTCLICKKSFFHRGALNVHMKTVHQRTSRTKLPKLITCDLCKKSISHALGGYRHFSNCHKKLCLGNYDEKFKENELIKCSFCKQVIVVEEYALHKHKEISAVKFRGRNYQAIRCIKCNHNFAPGHYVLHVEVHKSRQDFKDVPNTWKCDKCGKTFQHGGTKTRHQKKCDLPRYCIFCDRVFPDYGKLEMHIRTHTREKPYFCYICNVSFPGIGGLNQHLITDKHEMKSGCKFKPNSSSVGAKKPKKRDKCFDTVRGPVLRRFNCSHCKFQAYDQDDIMNHMETCHAVKFAPIKTANEGNTTIDKEIMGTTKCHTCYLCMKSFYGPVVARTHVKLCESKHCIRNQESNANDVFVENSVPEEILRKPCLVLVKH